MYACGSFHVHNGNRYPADESERHEPLFAIREAIVFERERWPFKHPRRVDKVEPVIFEVA